MFLWPNRLEIYNNAFRSTGIKTGINNVFDRKEFKKGATVLEINTFAHRCKGVNFQNCGTFLEFFTVKNVIDAI